MPALLLSLETLSGEFYHLAINAFGGAAQSSRRSPATIPKMILLRREASPQIGGGAGGGGGQIHTNPSEDLVGTHHDSIMGPKQVL